jgi:hypothetical protein
LEIRFCDDKKIKLDNKLNVSERKNFIVQIIEDNPIYQDYYYNKEDGKIILDFLATYLLNGEQSSQKKDKKKCCQNNKEIKTYFKNNSLLIIPSKETRTLKKIRLADKKIKRNNAKLSEIISLSESFEVFNSLKYEIISTKVQNDELKKDLYYLIDDYICETELLVNYGK